VCWATAEDGLAAPAGAGPRAESPNTTIRTGTARQLNRRISKSTIQQLPTTPYFYKHGGAEIIAPEANPYRATASGQVSRRKTHPVGWGIDLLYALSRQIGGKFDSRRTSLGWAAPARNVGTPHNKWEPPITRPRRGEGIEPSKPGAARPCQF
jgi:hypothetical protein